MKQKLLYLVCVLMGLGMQLSAQISKGTGSADDPYRIETADDLDDLRNYLGDAGADKYFRQENDIDLAQWIEAHDDPDIKENGWMPIGENANSNQTSFTGSFNGQGFRITGLWIDRPGMKYIGLFGALYADGTLQNIKVVLDAKGVKGNYYVGGLAGISHGEVTSCSVEGSGSVTAGGDYALAGGLTGSNMGSITTSYATVSVTAHGDYANIGGLTGYSYGFITTSYAIGTVTATKPSSFAGGLIGIIYENTENYITSCYYLQDEDTNSNLRGVEGYFDGQGDRPYDDNFYPPALTTNAAPLTASEMASEDSYTGWDFTYTWHFIESQPYPVLQVFGDFTSGNGSETDPYEIRNASQLNNVRNHLDKHFIQTKDIDLAQWIDNHPDPDIQNNGWMPVWKYTDWDEISFSGSFDGQGFRITGLWIDRTDMDYVGLFGALDANGTLENVKVVLAAQGVIGKDYVGGLVGYNLGKVTGCAVEGVERGEGVGGNSGVGGLTGINSVGSITSSYATVSVKAHADGASVGGLTGDNIGGHITSCYATGAVTATAAGAYNLNAKVGGLTGNNWFSSSSITTSYATGPVTAHGDYARVGGLTGDNSNSITSSYATGPVIAHGNYAEAGGLTGYNAGSITTSYATGSVTAEGDNANVGGLTGSNRGLGSTTTSYATGSVTATGQNAIVGGLIGVIHENRENDIISCYYLQEGNINQDLRGVGGYYDSYYTDYPYDNGSYPPHLLDHAAPLTAVGVKKQTSFDEYNWYFITDPNAADPDKNVVWMIHENITSPFLWWDYKPLDNPAIYHTVTLVVDSGIQLYNQSPGPLVVEDGGHLYLQFLPESPDLTAADLVLTINDVETAFKNFGDNHYYTYILNPVDKDYEIHIGLRDNTVGNAVVATGNVSVAIENGELRIENLTGKPVDVAVYSITGQAIAFVRGMSGTKMFDLPAGVYIVRAGNTTEKVIIND